MPTYTLWYKTDNPQRPIVQHRELCSIFCNSLEGERIWKRIDVYVCVCVYIYMCVCVCVCVCVYIKLNHFAVTLKTTQHCKSTMCLVAQSCLTLCNPMDSSIPGSSIHETFQAGILEWFAMPSARGSFQPRDGTQVSCIAGRFFTI